MPRGENPNSKENLKKSKPFNAETALKANQKSLEAKRRKRTLREQLEIMLADEITDKNGTKMEMQEAITVALLQRALKGNTRAYEIIRDTVGEKPIEQIMVADIDSGVIDEVEKMVKGK